MKKLLLAVSLILVSTGYCFAGAGHVTSKSISTSTQAFVTVGVSKCFTNVNLTNACTYAVLLDVVGVAGNTITTYNRNLVSASSSLTVPIPELDIIGFCVIIDANTPNSALYTYSNAIWADADYR